MATYVVKIIFSPKLSIFQGIEEDEISLLDELFPKTKEHGEEIGIRVKGEVEEEEEGDTSGRESVLSEASDSVSIEVPSTGRNDAPSYLRVR